MNPKSPNIYYIVDINFVHILQFLFCRVKIRFNKYDFVSFIVIKKKKGQYPHDVDQWCEQS